MNTTWPKWLSWTKGHTEDTTPSLDKFNGPDELRQFYLALADFDEHGIIHVPQWVHAGPFLYIILFGYEFYIGFRPTATWPEYFGDEGFFGSIARWLKRHNMGNLGAAGLRRVK